MTSTHRTRTLLGSLALIALAHTGEAQIVSADFGGYSNGALVGQNSWAQFGTVNTVPIQVTDGKAVIPGILAATTTTDNQDAVLSFANLINAPTTGSTTLYFGLQVRIVASGTNPSYFAALNTLQGTSTSSNFANIRIAARDNGDSTFSFGTRVTGQAGYAFAYGSSLQYGTTYNVVAEVILNAGATNDRINLFVSPSASVLNLSSIYAISEYGTGTANDPASIGAVVLSQFASSTVRQSQSEIAKVIVGTSSSEVANFLAIPEPSSFAAFAGLAALGGAALRRRRRAA